ncbi:hypothetical protein MOSE0_J06414 [Monosporozyma servazzii]
MDFFSNGENFSFGQIAFLVFQSVLQVVVISLAGFWSAHSGLLPKPSQKIISMLNVDLFTPCLIYSKMAKALSLAKILEISVIPLFFAVSTGISYFSGKLVSVLLGLDTDETNFVIGNSIFGNSNSLPVSLTLSLAYTLPNLAWDQIPNDTRDNVASRGLLYLLIFQQIGQMLRWSWGYNKLLKWSGESTINMPPSQIQLLLENANSGAGGSISRRASRADFFDASSTRVIPPHLAEDDMINHNEQLQPLLENDEENIADNDEEVQEPRPYLSSTQVDRNVETTPMTNKIWNKFVKVFEIIKNNLNPPLYSMLLGILVACFPSVQKELYREDSFLNNTFSEAVAQIGSVSIPLILIVLGANLYPTSDNFAKTSKHDKLVFGSIVGRMILPSCFLLPIIAIAVKYINVSILDDPIFVIVGFLLTVSPPAIQLTQITQLNEFFEAEMTDILFWGYAVLSLPVSITVVSAAIYVLQWANTNHIPV